jgi:flagellar biosynthesis anti-sigma factor FlgM
MKVEGPGKPKMAHLHEPGQVKESKPQRQEPSTSERVEVSSISKQLAESRGPEVMDMARVERLRNALQNNQLTVDPEAIAQAMLAEER